jgi:hypothetical protein
MKESNISYILLQGIFLASVIFFTLLVSTILFILHISISSFNLLLAFFCSAAVTYYFSEKSIRKTCVTSILGILIVLGCSLLCSHIYDCSWDGNTYHKSITGFLKYGWNPLYETFYDFAANNFPFITYSATWCDAYPKGTEIWGACVYSLFQNIEAGKSFNLLAIFALFCICYAFLQETRILKKWQILCCSCLLIINPVVLSQCFTYYNDGFLGQMLLLCFVALLYVTFYKSIKLKIISWYLIFVSINIGFNIKFSAVLFFAILCLSFFCYWIYERVKLSGFNKSTILSVKSSFGILAAAVIFGTLVTGCTSYVINIIRHKNPFYTMIGEDSTEMITSQLPNVFKEMSNIGRFIASLFSRTNSSKLIDNVEWKIPLTFNSDELWATLGYDTRTAGWGIFFSGILLIGMAVILIFLFKERKLSLAVKQITIILLLVLLGTVILIPGLSWARYCVVLFWLPVAVLLFIFRRLNKQKFDLPILSFIAEVIVVLLCLNVLPNVVHIYPLLQNSASTYSELEHFRVISNNSEVTIFKQDNGEFGGRFFNLYDVGAKNFTYGYVDSKNCTGQLFEQYSLFYNVVDGFITKNNLIDFLDCFEFQENYLLLIAVKDEASNALTDDIVKEMKSLGLDFDLRNHYRWAYLAALGEDGVIYENMADEPLYFDDNIEDIQITMFSAGYENGNTASILIGGKEYALNGRGLNIVVYDKVNGDMVDSICVDTYLDNTLTR